MADADEKAAMGEDVETRSMPSKGSKSSKVSRVSLSAKLSGLIRSGTSVAMSFKGGRGTTATVAAMADVEKGDTVETISLVTVRKEESIESEVVLELPIGTALEIVDTGADRRIMVKTTKDNPTQVEGWISSKTKLNEPLVTKRRQDGYGVAEFEVGGQHEVKSTVTVRKEEHLDSEVVQDLQPGTIVRILEVGKQNNRRARVSCASCEGWISTSTKRGELLIGKVDDGQKLVEKSGGMFGGNRVKDLLEASRTGDLASLKKTVEGSSGLISRFTSRLNLNASDIRGKTALMYSAAFGHKELIEFLLTKKEVDVNVLDDTQKSALHHACKGARARRDGSADECQVAIVEALLKSGAQLDSRDHNGCTALMFAAANGYEKVTIMLLTAEASVNCKDFEGHSPMAYAKNFGHTSLLKLLKGMGAEPTESDAEEEKEEAALEGTESVAAAEAAEEVAEEDEEEEAAAPAAADAAGGEAKPAAKPKKTTASGEDGEKPKAKTKAKAKAKDTAKKDAGEEAAKPKGKAKGKGKAKAKKEENSSAMTEAIAGEEATADAVVVQEVAKEEEDEKTAALRKLEAVVKNVESPKELEAVIHQCEAAGATEDELKAAHEKVKELKTRQGALSDLRDAINDKDCEALRAAIAKATEVKLPKAEIEAAANVLKAEEPKEEARKGLREAQSACNAKVMQDAIAKAKKGGLTDAEVKEWEDMLAGAESKEQAQGGLAAALKSLVIADIKWAIEQAKSAGLDAGKIAAAEKILNEEAPKQLAREEIEAALASGDDAKLEATLKLAKEAGLPASEIAPVEEAIEKKNKQKVLLAGVLKALADSQMCDMKELDSVRDAKESLSDAIAKALGMGVPEADVFDAEIRRKRLHNTAEDLKGAIRVFCRIRPMNQREKDLKDHIVTTQIDPMTLEVKEEKGTKHNFIFDAVFTPGTQEEIFEDCKDLVQSAADGYNVTLFAYGQTGAGKTFTMAGVPGMLGVSPRTIEEIFRVTAKDEARFAFTVLGSMLELYCQDLFDLLSKGNPAASKQKLQIREQKDKTITVEHLSAEQCNCAQDLTDLLDKGMKNRVVSATAMNSESSRSHLVLMIQIISVNRETKEQTKGKILIVDLAGSERLGKSQTTGQAQKESIEINKSLTCLGNVIEALTNPKKGQLIPYRDSNLTLVMKDALGGTAKTLMFVNCSPASTNIDETLNALKYAQRAKNVENKQDKNNK